MVGRQITCTLRLSTFGHIFWLLIMNITLAFVNFLTVTVWLVRKKLIVGIKESWHVVKWNCLGEARTLSFFFQQILWLATVLPLNLVASHLPILAQQEEETGHWNAPQYHHTGFETQTKSIWYSVQELLSYVAWIDKQILEDKNLLKRGVLSRTRRHDEGWKESNNMQQQHWKNNG